MGDTLEVHPPGISSKKYFQFIFKKVTTMEKGRVYIDSSYRLHYPEGATHMDGFPEDLREVVHNHWGNFPPQHPLISDLFGIAFFFLWLVSFFGNGCVIYVFLTSNKLRSPTNIFIVNLAFSDLCMMTTQGLPCVINAFVSDFWMWGAFLCKLYACVGGIFGVASIMTMVVIGYDRYNVIVKGFKGTKITFGKATLILLFVWKFEPGSVAAEVSSGLLSPRLPSRLSRRLPSPRSLSRSPLEHRGAHEPAALLSDVGGSDLPDRD